jgi:hypothetical protein
MIFIGMKANFINSFNSKKKQLDKISIEVRLSMLTVFHFELDITSKKGKLVLCNFGLEFGW